ncbi:MAG: hypothetical protein STSR0001_18160 [Methanothrix sp.]|jgi:hypothetical protein
MNLVFKLIFGKSGIYIIGSILNGNPGCYTYEHITVAMLIPGMGLTSASKLFLLKLGISRLHMLHQG